MSWSDLRDQAIQDFKSSKILSDHEDFGNSAYLLQQSIEKFVKSLVLKYKLSDKSLVKIGHQPLTELWIELREQEEKQMEKSSNETSKKLHQGLQTSLEVIGEFFAKANSEFKIPLWKESLQIILNEDEQKLYKSLKEDFTLKIEPSINEFIKEFSLFFEKKLKPFLQFMQRKQKAQLQSILDSLSSDLNMEEIEKTHVPESINVNNFIQVAPKFFEKLEQLINFLRQDPRKSPPIDSDFSLIILLSWIFKFSTTILKAYVHESIGRYPIIIEGKSSRLWYKEKFEALDVLRTEIQLANESLNKMLVERLYYKSF